MDVALLVASSDMTGKISYWNPDIRVVDYVGWTHIIQDAHERPYSLEIKKHNYLLAEYRNLIDYDPLPCWWAVV